MTLPKNFPLCIACGRRTHELLNMVQEHIWLHLRLYLPKVGELTIHQKNQKAMLRKIFEANLDKKYRIYTEKKNQRDTAEVAKMKRVYKKKWNDVATRARKKYRDFQQQQQTAKR